MNSLVMSQSVKAVGAELGFDAVGIAGLRDNDHGNHLLSWLSAGFAADMGYMRRQAVQRLKPSMIVPGARNAVVVLRNYFNVDPPPQSGSGWVAKYARGPDYHHTLSSPMADLSDHLVELGGSRELTCPFVDAGPVPERELGCRAGLGWIGKNAMLISPSFGSFTFIGVVTTDLSLRCDDSFGAERCGKCSRCIEACPTGAINQARMIDSRKCISYLTIEHRGEINSDFHRAVGERVFGCDVCQDVCPWNGKFAKAVDDKILRLRSDLGNLDLPSVVCLTKGSFKKRFGDSPFMRPGVGGMKRNARIVMSNQLRGT